MSAQGAAPAALEKLASLGEPATGPGMKGEKVTWQSSGGGGGDGGGGAAVVATACRAGVKLWELSDGAAEAARLTGSFAVPSGNYVEAVAFDRTTRTLSAPPTAVACRASTRARSTRRGTPAPGPCSPSRVPQIRRPRRGLQPEQALCVVTCGDDRPSPWTCGPRARARAHPRGPRRGLRHGATTGPHDQPLLGAGARASSTSGASRPSPAPLLELSEEPGGATAPGATPMARAPRGGQRPGLFRWAERPRRR